MLISADTDFDTLLASSGASEPSVLLVRRISGRRAAQIIAILVANLAAVADDLAGGAIVVVGEDSLRVRPLPILRGKRPPTPDCIGHESQPVRSPSFLPSGGG
ncbi:hypothetical protein Van01_60590 [Micromonospora andamanensis]|uniref:Uncharacterized protein n=1 Tax=Micromonospora andamanensis TaxID=1287068 RepID=A0ABQ4I4M4_9ACTN|nr:hypothetical protein [Micromonospora andamanensis]GIJ12845.1 hypothetical protein Van01_60590 [Micromonospora andamanensis]